MVIFNFINVFFLLDPNYLSHITFCELEEECRWLWQVAYRQNFIHVWSCGIMWAHSLFSGVRGLSHSRCKIWQRHQTYGHWNMILEP